MLGFDIGGTFTDLALFDDEKGEVRITKVPSNAADPAAAVMAGLRDLGVPAGDIRTIVHGTTVTTNALLERRGAQVLLVTTSGFGDLIEIGRTMRMVPGLFNTKFVRREPLVPRELRLEVLERTSGKGQVVREIADQEIEKVRAEVDALQPEAIAVCFLNSYQNSHNEDRLVQALRNSHPNVYVVSSSEVMSEFREYERFNTTAVNAFLGPLLNRYLKNLTAGLEKNNYKHPIYVMSSSGGILTATSASTRSERTLLSGPVGGVSAAIALGESIAVRNLITCDMGGTSTDVCLIENLVPGVVTNSIIDGIAVKAVHIDIHTVGAGGGSIAVSDQHGEFRVGPESAGARPGPACYGFGGTSATVTDANVVLGRLGGTGLIGGRMRLNKDASVAAIQKVADALGMPDLFKLAQGIIDVAVAKMVGAVREISVNRGLDPRDYALVCFGGAGPMHAVEVAQELGSREVIIPRHPGNFSAMGLLSSDLRHDYVKTHLAKLNQLSSEDIRDAIGNLEELGRIQLRSENVSEAEMELRSSCDLRYVGQGWEISIPIVGGASSQDLATSFHSAHEKIYGHSRPNHSVELVNFRVAAIGKRPRPSVASQKASADTAPVQYRSVYFLGKPADCPVFDRAVLGSDWTVTGPAIIDEFGSTTVLLPEWRARTDAVGNIRITPV